MWRIGPGRSPSRASRALVNASSGIPSTPHASNALLTAARRNTPCSVRTWRSSPECELAMIASSAGSRSNSPMPPASTRATSPNGLTVERSVTTRSTSPMARSRRPVASTSTMSPRCTLSSMPLRTWRTRIGGTILVFAPALRGRAAVAVTERFGLLLQGSPSIPRETEYGRNDHRPGNLTRAQRRAIRRPPPGRDSDATSRVVAPSIEICCHPADRPRRCLCYDAADRPRWFRSRRPEVPVPAPNLHVSRHPAVLHKLAILRDEKTEPKKFREVVRELSWLLGYEALEDVRVSPITVKTPLEETEAGELGERIGLVPILRAGLGMVDAMLELMPTAQVWHLGLFRDERTLRPVEYYNKLPDSATVDLCLILDPMLATGGSATAAIEVLKRWGAQRIKLVAAPEGVEAVATAHPDVEIYTASLDRQLNDKGYIQPGLGDAGDRQFGTGN